MIKYFTKNNNIEHFQQSVLTSIPLIGTYDPNIKTGTQSTTRTSDSTPDAGPQLPVKTNSYLLRSYKKPVSVIPLTNQDVDTPALKNTRIAGYNAQSPRMPAAEQTKAETDFLKQPLNSFTDTYDSDNKGTSAQLQLALNMCTQQTACYGIVIENTDINLPAAALQYSSHSYTYKLFKKPELDSSADKEFLICDPAFYTFIKDTSSITPTPPSCPPLQLSSKSDTSDTSDDSDNIFKTAPSGPKSYTYMNAIKPVPKKTLLDNKLFVYGLIFVILIIIIGSIYYVMVVKKKESDDDDSYKLLLKKKGGYFFFV